MIYHCATIFFVFPSLFILSAILLITQPLFSQVNTEKFRKYDVEKGFQANLQTTFTTKAGNTHYNTLKATSRLDYSATKFDYFLVANFEAKSASKTHRKRGFYSPSRNVEICR